MRVKSEARRQAIIDVAKEAFCQQGFENTSMSEIANRVGGSKATLYNYFSSKEEIFTAVMDSAAAEHFVVGFDILHENKDIETVLTELGIHYLKAILSPDILAIRNMAYSEADRSDIGRHFYENGPKRGWQLISQYLQKQQTQHVLRPCNSEIAAMHLKALFEAEIVEPYALRAVTDVSDPQLEQMVTRAVRVFLCAYQI